MRTASIAYCTKWQRTTAKARPLKSSYERTPYVVASDYVANGNRCAECYSDPESMGRSHILCAYDCNECDKIKSHRMDRTHARVLNERQGQPLKAASKAGSSGYIYIYICIYIKKNIYIYIYLYIYNSKVQIRHCYLYSNVQVNRP